MPLTFPGLSKKLDLGKLRTTTKTGAYTATNLDQVILCDASSAAFTVTLPAASGRNGRRFWIEKTDSTFNAVTIDGNGAETINGATTKLLNIQYHGVEIVCNGTAWFIINEAEPQEFCSVFNSTGQSITQSTITALTFDSENTDTYGLHSIASNTSRITVQRAGSYLIKAHYLWNNLDASVRQFGRIRKNGTVNLASLDFITAAVFPGMIVVDVVDLVASDYVEVVVYHESVGAIDIYVDADTKPQFQVHKLKR